MAGSIGVTYRSKIAKIVPIGNPRWPPWQPSWKFIFRFFSWTERLQNVLWSIEVTCRKQKMAKIVRSEIQDGRHGSHLENLLFTSSPKPKSQLTSNLLGSITVTYRSKIAKIVPIGNPRWPPWRPSWECIFRFFSWTERLIDFKLGMKHRGDL